MNKKGYTLIEIIVVIAIIASIGTIGAIGLSKIISNSKQTRSDDMIEEMKATGNTYFTIYSEYSDYSSIKTDLYNTGTLIIPVQNLKEALLVDQKQKNPKDNRQYRHITVGATHLRSAQEVKLWHSKAYPKDCRSPSKS